jgi:predicted aspartyl protease
MAIRSILWFSTVQLLFLAVIPVASAQEVPFQLISGNRAVIKGTVAGGHELALLVDTGTECTVIDRRAAKRLQLTFLPQTAGYAALGKVGRAPVAIVRDLNVGPISTSVTCLVGDIPAEGVDVVLGLDLLSKTNFEIDYKQRKVVFDPGDKPSASVPFEPDTMLVVINARVHGKTIRMLVDTGAANHFVFGKGPIVWLGQDEGPVTAIPYMGNSLQCREVLMKVLTIGSIEWKDLKAMAISNPKPVLWDAVLSVGSLGLKQIYFDFEHRSLSWAR